MKNHLEKHLKSSKVIKSHQKSCQTMTISSHLSLVCVVDVVPVTVFDVAVDVVLVEDVAVEVAEVRVAVVTVPVVVGAGGRTRLNSCCFRELWDIIYIYI